MAKTMPNRPGLLERLGQAMTNLADSVQGSQAWNSIFRPGSIFRKGYTDSPRNRSYVVMNSVLYHLHPVKVKRHAVKVSYTLCLGGLSFFLFILLTAAGGTATAAPFIMAGLPALAGFAAGISVASVLCLLALPKLQAASSSADTVSSIQPPPSTRSPS